MVTLYIKKKRLLQNDTSVQLCVYVWHMWCGVVQCMCVVFVHSCKWLALFSHSLTILISPYYMATPLKRHFGSQTPSSRDGRTHSLPCPNTWLSVKSSQDPLPCHCPRRRAVLCSIVPCIVFDSLSPLALAQLTKVVLVCGNSSPMSGWSVKRPFHS